MAWAALVLALAAPIGWGAVQPNSWDVDNIAPGSVLRGLAAGFGPGWHASYGPLPYLLTAVLYLPVLAALRLAGALGEPAAEFPYGFAHPDAAMFALILIARALTLALALGLAWSLVRAHRAAGGRRGWIVPLLLLGSPVFAYYARTSNVDMHYAFWLAAAFALAESRAATPGRLAWAAAAATAALCSKEQSAPLAVVAGGWALWRAARGDAGPRRARAAAGVAGAALATYVALYALPFNLEGWRAHHHFVFHVARYERAYPLTPGGLAGLAGRLVELAPVGLGWPVLLGLALAIVGRAPLAGLGPRAVAVGLYVAGFLAPVGYVYPRFLLPLLLLAVPLAARGVEAALERAAGRAWAAPLAAALAVLALTGAPNLARVQLTDTRLAAGAWLRARVPPGATVEIAGNPRFQLHPPRDVRVLVTSPDSLRASPRGPRGDVVLLSGVDGAFFERDPAVRAAWYDSLAAGYEGPRVFRPAMDPGNVRDLFVSPEVRAWVRRGLPPRAPGDGGRAR